MLKTMKSISLVVALAGGALSAHAETLSIEGGGSASLTGIVPQAWAQFTPAAGYDLQVSLGQALTRSAIKVGAGRLDLAVVPPPAFNAMQRGVGPYANTAEQAQSFADNLRMLFTFPGGSFHPIVWADSGIDSWDDMAGKRIYVGPPAGAAANQARGMVHEASGGLEDGSDYEGVRLPWESASQAFQDGQFDMYIMSAAVGQQSVQELSLQRDIRILGVPDEVVDSEGWRNYLEDQAVRTEVVPAGTYQGQVNGDMDQNIMVTVMMLGANKNMSDETAYALTKSFFDNLDNMQSANALLARLNADDPFAGANMPVHPGAARYYEEQGINIPEHLIAD
ncbi:TAXI family TRAP transporter solute-binding subunit [Halomonas sp. PAMB 3232]|uniref:TAXI family TRAP transporter solute-binding subunit n=1 Tax=Halomonas sp. PAMB 3232 TaxID=3075221 RepID=UPI002898157D|nr:TAXI family TRAP transporter solute-binding subunit [Halomonas sp. PAMB 3232]WNL39059.1 TAXI family TRAP transporter solute-binding subunit [Halomonas sp. PAMB 3232]